jgi:sugar/nucleoside kinase (ribokinase family)
MKKLDIISIGGATRDILFYTREGIMIANPKDLTRQRLLGFEYGAKIISDKAFFTLGGGACNTSISFARQGLKAGSLIHIGGDRPGESIIKDLKHEGVSTHLIKICQGCTTGFSLFIIPKEGKKKDHVAFLYRGTNDDLRIARSDLSRINSKWIYLSSLTGHGWRHNARQIIRLVKTKKIKFAWNPGETQILAGLKGLNPLLKLTDILVINQDEAIELALSVHKKVKNIKDSHVLARIVKQWVRGMVLITIGRQGAYCYDGKQLHYCKIFPIEVVDTTGAGDSFGSTFVAGIMKGRTIKESLCRASINSGHVVNQIGAQTGLLKQKEIDRIYKKYKYKLK